MDGQPAWPRGGVNDEVVLRTILEGTATTTGEQFFRALVRNLARALATHGAWVTEYRPESRRLRALAFWIDDGFIDWEAPIDGTPCEAVVEGRRRLYLPDQVVDLYPGASALRAMGAVSYLGVPLLDLDERVLGHLAVLHTAPLPDEPRLVAIFQIFAARAAAELQRLRAEREVREREQKVGRLVDGAMDAIIELDGELCLTRLNPAADRLLRVQANTVIGTPFARFLAAESRAKLRDLIDTLDARPEGEKSLWIPGGLRVLPEGGPELPAEASLSQYDLDGRRYHSLILRSVLDRLEAEQRIRTLEVETEYLRAELGDLESVGDMLGTSPALGDAIRDVQVVAGADTAVLILGETGTGKELIARAIHRAGPRRGRPLVKVNCASIPADLIESELFGHEKGAFTSATARREGRFALAHGGTIFLDEVGELPLALQPKLLRILQEGEFEPLGSGVTRKVDVRIISATNRDLEQMVRAGAYREDLYYRLNVFPIRMPPLRERGEDVLILAAAFAEKVARKIGRPVPRLQAEERRRLLAYDWPGNVRELQNVIERAVLTGRNGQLNLDRALPEGTVKPARQTAPSADRILTARELEELERANLRHALERAGWRVSGDQGAAALLGIHPSTLSSRMKALGLQRPR